SHQRLLADARGNDATNQQAGGASAGSASGVSATGLGQAATGPGQAAPESGTGGAPTAGGVSRSGATAGGSTGAGAATASGTTSCLQKKSTVTIGTVGQQSGVAGGTIAGGAKAVQAWVAMVNARNGVNCHPVKYIVLDDGGDPSRNQSLVQQLVEQDHAIAMVYVDAPLTGQASLNYLTSKRVPVVGTELGSPWVYSSPMYFPQGASGNLVYAVIVAAVAAIGKPNGQNKIGTLECVEVNICSGADATVRKYASQFGLVDVYDGHGSLVQPDYTASCQAAQSAGAQILLIALDANSIS